MKTRTCGYGEKNNNYPTLIYNHLYNDGEKIQSINIVAVVDFLAIFKKSPLWPQVLSWKFSFVWYFWNN